MRLNVRVLGLDLLSVEIVTDEPLEDDQARDLSGGTVASMPVGFVARYDKPREDDGRDYE